ncbi:MAG: hypothetical protein HOK06_03435 [Rhodospirillaceae bacterium]|nr:hypothetical protein [Rhodospirillaceae bacterium]MBT4220276.1 hypothetical protein [Rhodospirillaceae bacterium]MBT4463682.1 hypothetical protein [Rhodospirillaceae bacterium]MBT5014565.1 hypothetical protein [Rhodospirillaceae bacterium]MBT5308429.1 hypothetical protein [Rhodospirillaceae bacterium]
MIPYRLIALLPVVLALAACPAATQKTPTTATPIITVTSPPARPALLGSQLMGLDQSGLAALVGEPSFRRVDAPAELWQYRSDDCLLDVYLYRGEEKSSAHAVTHIAARRHDETAISADACVATMDIPPQN